MRLKYFSEPALSQLLSSTTSNLPYYSSDHIWVDEVLEGKYARESRIEIDSPIILVPPDAQSKYDLENTKRLYVGLKELDETQATNPKLWAYLAHVDHWDYMRARWPVESKQPQQRAAYVKEHYFHAQNASRSLIRHGIARLWWYGYLTYDGQRENPWELTGKLLETLDIAQTLLERNISRNHIVFHAILEFFISEDERIPKGNRGREFIRSLVKYLNFHGGVSILDSLSPTDLKQTLRDKLDALLVEMGS